MTKRSVKLMMIILMVVVIGLYFVSGTYARYTSAVTGTGTAKVARWDVKLGDTKLTAENKTTLTFRTEDNEFVVDGFIAPATRLVSNMLTINPEGTQVAVDYIVELGTLKSSNTAALDKVKVVGVQKLGEGGAWENIGTLPDSEVKGGVIYLPDQATALTSEDSVSLRVVLEWENLDTTEANASDTAVGIAAPQDLAIDVNVTVQQHIGEGMGM